MDEYGMNSEAPNMVAVLISAVIPLVMLIAFYIFATICAKKICQKCGKDPGGIIWVPIIGWLPVMECAGMQSWMIVLYVFIGPVWWILLGLGLAKARNKPPALGAILGLFCVPGLLIWMAFTD